MMGHEVLEQRRLLSATLSGGVLTITGTDGNDSITVRQEDTSIVVDDNITMQTFDVAQVNTLSIDMKAGDDFLRLRSKANTRNVTAPATILGGDGNDLLRGGLGSDSIDGGAGDDTLDGGGGSDVLNGGPNGDYADYSQRTKPVFITIDGKPDSGEVGENDTLITEGAIGGAGNDTIKITADDPGNKFFGRGGIDCVDYSAVTNITGVVPISLDDFPNDGKNNHDSIHSDIEIVIGTNFDDSIVGSNGDNTLVGGEGDDTIFGDRNQDTFAIGGDDVLIGGRGRDYLDGNYGRDTILAADRPVGDVSDRDSVGGSRNDILQDDTSTVFVDSHGGPAPSFAYTPVEGTPGDDIIIITQKDGVTAIEVNGVVTHKTGVLALHVAGGAGNDLIVLSKSDGSQAFPGAATLFGSDGNDTLRGGSGDDDLRGDDGNDLLFGNDGKDFLFGGKGDDTLHGGAGNDLLIGKDGADDMDGGDGIDTVDYSGVKFPLAVTMDDNIANDGIAGEHDNVRTTVENLDGGLESDRIVGNGSNNVLAGGYGNDSLRGGDGLDVLVGGPGTDTLKGVGGVDLYAMQDGSPDIFDAPLTADHRPLIDFVSGDSGEDFSTANNATLA